MVSVKQNPIGMDGKGSRPTTVKAAQANAKLLYAQVMSALDANNALLDRTPMSDKMTRMKLERARRELLARYDKASQKLVGSYENPKRKNHAENNAVESVIFRKFDGEVIAFFPYLTGDSSPYTMTSYSHIGQHGAASEDFYRDTKKALSSEYLPLKRELHSLGYRLKVIDRMPSNAFNVRRAELQGLRSNPANSEKVVIMKIQNPNGNKTYRIGWSVRKDGKGQFRYKDFKVQADSEQAAIEKADLLRQQLGYETFVEYVAKQQSKNRNPKQPVKRNATAADFKKHQTNRLRELSQMFQGEANGDKHRVIESDYAPKDKYRLGYLVQIKIKDGGRVIPINFNGETAILAGDLKNNLWAVGEGAILGNVRKPAKGQLRYLGEVTQVDYVTAKKHIEGGKTVRFYHKLGEVTGEKPNLFIDSDGFPVFVGGGYDIWNVGIVN